MTTYAGQNIGAGKMDRVTKGAKQGTLMAVGVSATITAIILIFGKYLMGIFTETVELVEMSRYLMGILTHFWVLFTSKKGALMAVGVITLLAICDTSGKRKGEGEIGYA